MPNFDRVETKSGSEGSCITRIALVTSGGIVSKGKPGPHRKFKVLLTMESMILQELQILQKRHNELHIGGYDPVYANEDPDRVIPW